MIFEIERTSGGNPKYGPITNLDEEDDMWLLKNCPLTFVTDRIKDQYNLGSKKHIALLLNLLRSVVTKIFNYLL